MVKAAQAAEKKWRIPASITLAQWGLESGFGTHMPPNSNNPFGIKAVGNQPSVTSSTTEHLNGKDVRVKAKFKKFSSLDDAFDEHGQLLATSNHYKNARTVLPDPDKFAKAITGTYANDPAYATKLGKLMDDYNLRQYDQK